MSDQRLNPCIRCGDSATIYLIGYGKKHMSAMCDNPKCGNDSDTDGTESQVIEDWNEQNELRVKK